MTHEVIVIGAGPAGLTAALYLARYRRDVLVLHDGKSRALRIPKTHNAPGFPDGVEGPELIERMIGHATSFGARIEEAHITDVTRKKGGFEVMSEDGSTWTARAVILASGILLNQVDLPHEVHEQAIKDDVLRYCPICDGYEHSDRKIGVVGCDSNGAAEALFLRQFSSDITLMPLHNSELSKAQLRELAEAGIAVRHGSLVHLDPQAGCMNVMLEGENQALSFDVVYPALGCSPRAELAAALGLKLNDEGCIPGSALKGDEVAGFFAAGDVLAGLDQISVAMGHGAQAATSAHNWLREQDNQTLEATS